MKTNQVLVRKMSEFDVFQRTSDGMFNATALLDAWNSANPKKERRIDNFWSANNLGDYMTEIIKDDKSLCKSVSCKSLKIGDLEKCQNK